MSKKGQLVLKPIIEILLGTMVVVSFLLIAQTFGTPEYSIAKRIAQDGAVLVDAFSTVPGNIWLKYPGDVSKYDINLSEGVVGVLIKPPATHIFPVSGLIVSSLLSKPKQLVFFKDGDQMSISGEAQTLKKYMCPDGSPKGKKPFGGMAVHMKITKETQPVAERLFPRCSEDGICKDQPQRQADVFLNVVPPEEKGSVGIAIRYRLDGQSKTGMQLACSILNTILVHNPDMPTWLLPADNPLLAKSPESIALEIEVGSAEHAALVRALIEVLR